MPADPAPPATVIVQTCNHCPYVIAWNPRLRQAAEDYAPKGVRFLQINSNDASRYPADSLDHMKRFVADQSWPIPYLYDESQEVAQALDAVATPHVFVFDSDAPARLPGRTGRRPHRRQPGSRVAPWRDRRGAGRRAAGSAGDAAARLQREVARLTRRGDPARTRRRKPPAATASSPADELEPERGTLHRLGRREGRADLAGLRGIGEVEGQRDHQDEHAGADQGDPGRARAAEARARPP